jgi:mannose-6-phosphate isomerase-like protein (cupin superfamily)
LSTPEPEPFTLAVMPGEPIVITPADLNPGGSAQGATLSVANWSASGVATEVAPLHVHYADDEAWYVVEGALRFRLADRELVAEAGSTVLVPAGVAHTFGNAGPGPSRYLIIMPSRLQELIAKLHQVDRSEHAAVYRQFQSELLE